MLAQIFGGGVFFGLIAALAFVFLPADSCQRANNATTLIHGALGLVPFSGEALFRRDMNRSWADIDDWSYWVHARVVEYFEIGQCQPAFKNIYGSNDDHQKSSEWLLENDPELYKLLAPENHDQNRMNVEQLPSPEVEAAP